MKYKNIGMKAGYKIFVRKRESAFDKDLTLSDSKFGAFEDHKEMKTYEYAAFQKEQYKKKAIEKRKRRTLYLITAIVVILVIFSIPFIYHTIFDTKYLNLKY